MPHNTYRGPKIIHKYCAACTQSPTSVSAHTCGLYTVDFHVCTQHTDSPISYACMHSASHKNQMSMGLHKDRHPRVAQEHIPRVACTYSHTHTHTSAQALPCSRWSSGPQARGGWHCGEQAGHSEGRVWQEAAPPGRPWQAVGVSGAQAWHSTRWHE
jgi:hypothetical protein